MATPATLLFAASRPITFALVLKALRRDYATWLPSTAQIQCPPAFSSVATALSEALQKPVSTDPVWEDQQELEARSAYMTRLEAALEAAKSRSDCCLILVSEGVLGDLSILMRQPQDVYALVCVHSDRSVTFRGKTDVYPFLSHAKDLAASVVDTVKGAQVPTAAAAVVSDLKRVAGKQSTELLKALDTYNERLVTAIDRTHDQSERHLTAIENALYRKSQAKLGRLDDFIQAQKPITAGLEEAKREIEESSDINKLQKRLDAVNAMLQRCQSDLKALDDMNEFEDDGLGKAMPLHILEDPIVNGTTVSVKVVNLKTGTFRGVKLLVTDGQGDVGLDVLEVRPGVQIVPVTLQHDLRSIQKLRLVLLLDGREISNELVIEFTDPQPQARSPVRQVSPPGPPGVSDPPNPPNPPSDLRSLFLGPPLGPPGASGPSSLPSGLRPFPPGPPLGPPKFAAPLSHEVPVMPVPQFGSVDDLSEREAQILSELEEILGDKGEEFKQRFLRVVRRPGNEGISIEEIADRLLDSKAV